MFSVVMKIGMMMHFHSFGFGVETQYSINLKKIYLRGQSTLILKAHIHHVNPEKF